MIQLSTQEVIAYYVQHRLAREGFLWQYHIRYVFSEPEYIAMHKLKTHMKLVEDHFCKIFQELCDCIKISVGLASNLLTPIADILYEDEITWGRILTLLIFCGSLAVKYMRKDCPCIVFELTEWAVTYIDGKLASWIIRNGGWSQLLEYLNLKTISPYFVLPSMMTSPQQKLNILSNSSQITSFYRTSNIIAVVL